MDAAAHVTQCSKNKTPYMFKAMYSHVCMKIFCGWRLCKDFFVFFFDGRNAILIQPLVMFNRIEFTWTHAGINYCNTGSTDSHFFDRSEKLINKIVYYAVVMQSNAFRDFGYRDMSGMNKSAA